VPSPQLHHKALKNLKYSIDIEKIPTNPYPMAINTPHTAPTAIYIGQNNKPHTFCKHSNLLNAQAGPTNNPTTAPNPTPKQTPTTINPKSTGYNTTIINPNIILLQTDIFLISSPYC
jgi:hypothetical protein